MNFVFSEDKHTVVITRGWFRKEYAVLKQPDGSHYWFHTDKEEADVVLSRKVNKAYRRAHWKPVTQLPVAKATKCGT